MLIQRLTALWLLCWFVVAALAPAAAQAPAEVQAPPVASVDVFKPSADAQKFKFGQVDLDLLRQVNAFDKYVEEKGWVYRDPLIDDYVERVGRAVVPPQVPEYVTWRFRVLRDPTPNAFALPNGSIYVHSGLLSRLENEAQLSAVLAHEATHVFNRHTYLSYHDMRKRSVAVHIIIAGATAASVAGVDYRVINALANVIPLAVIASMFGYRRELEHEADVYAVGVIHKAGYDPVQVPSALELLRKGPEVDLSKEPLFWADHPKLADRVRDTTALARQYPADGHGRVDAAAYESATRNAVRHDAGLAMILGRPRTAVAIAKRLVALQPNNPDYHALLGDAYRSLGGRMPVPADEEQSDDAKNKARKLLGKMTLLEYDNALMDAPGGRDHFKANAAEAERCFRHALELDAVHPAAHRGLGFLYERIGRNAEAVTHLQKYLQLAPQASDARQVRQRIEALQKKVAVDDQAVKREGGGL